MTGQSVADLLSSTLGEVYGAFNYYAGASGSVTVVGKILQILISSDSDAGTLSINGGPSIPVRASTGLAISPVGKLTNATLVFTNTVMYYIEVAQ